MKQKLSRDASLRSALSDPKRRVSRAGRRADREPLQRDPDLAKWCAALSTQSATDEVPPGWLRMSELATLLGKSESHMAKLIRRAADDGRCETASFRVQCGQKVMALRHYKLK